MLQYNQGGCPDVTPTFTKVPVMDNSEPSLNEGMFENFRNFVLKSIKKEVELGKDASIQNCCCPTGVEYIVLFILRYHAPCAKKQLHKYPKWFHKHG